MAKGEGKKEEKNKETSVVFVLSWNFIFGVSNGQYAMLASSCLDRHFMLCALAPLSAVGQTGPNARKHARDPSVLCHSVG